MTRVVEMWRAALAVLVVTTACAAAHGAEMSGGTYEIQVSAIAAGGGRGEDLVTQYTVWDSVAGPSAVGAAAGAATELYAGVYTPAVPEPAASGIILLAWLARRISRRSRPSTSR
jgi:hypothetical protein